MTDRSLDGSRRDFIHNISLLDVDLEFGRPTKAKRKGLGRHFTAKNETV